MRLAALAVLALFFAVWPAPVQAAAPRVIIVQGDLLAVPVVLDDWQENQEFLMGLADPVQSPALEGRPRIRFEMYWGAEVEGLLADGVPPLDLRGKVSAEEAFFYPAVADAPAILDYHGYRLVGESSLRVLANHGVPTSLPSVPQLPAADADRHGEQWPAFVAFAAISALLVLASAYRWLVSRA